MTDQQVIRISFHEALRFLLRGLPIALVVAGVAAAVAFFANLNPEPVYRSTAMLLATRPSSTNVPSLIVPSQVDPEIYRLAIVEGELLPEALARVSGGEVSEEALEEWRRRVRVRVDENLVSSVVRIEVEDGSPTTAATVANALADALLAWDRTRVSRNVQATLASLNRSLAILGAQLLAAQEAGDMATQEVLEAQRSQLIADRQAAESLNLSAVVLGLLEPFRQAAPEAEPVNDRTTFFTVVAFAIFFLLTYVFLLARRLVDPAIMDPSDLAKAGGAEPVAVVAGRRKDAPEFQAGIGRVATAVPARRAAPGDAPGAAPASVVVVTAPTRMGAQHLLARSLAEAYARAGVRTLLVNADLASTVGMTQAPVGNATVPMVNLTQRPDRAEPTTVAIDHGVYLDLLSLTPGTQHSASFGPLTQRLAALLAAWRDQYGVVIVDTSALAEASVALALADTADHVLVVAVQHVTQQTSVREAVQELGRAGHASIGTVLFTDASLGAPIAGTATRGRQRAGQGRERPTAEPDARVVASVTRRQ